MAAAALPPCVGLLEDLVSWGGAGRGRKRRSVRPLFICRLAGLGSVFSFNLASDFNPLFFVPTSETATMVDIVDRLTATAGLPIGGLLIAAEPGWG